MRRTTRVHVPTCVVLSSTVLLYRCTAHRNLPANSNLYNGPRDVPGHTGMEGKPGSGEGDRRMAPLLSWLSLALYRRTRDLRRPG